MFYNVLDNAVKAVEEGGFVLLKGTRLADGYEVKVMDNGRGIPEGEIHRITEAFYMVDKSRSRKEGGAGIGMALCQKIMIALSLPSMIFSIQDGYLTATVETGTREPYDTETAEEAYPKDIAIRMSRVAQTRWGNMAVSVENMYIGQELFQTIMAEIMSQDYMTILLSVEN